MRHDRKIAALRLTFAAGPLAGQTVSMTGDRLTIGRTPGNDLVLEAGNVSRNHAVIERHGDGFFIRDLGSSNGTWLGGQQISAPRTLAGNDQLRIGANEARVEIDLPVTAPPIPPPAPVGTPLPAVTPGAQGRSRSASFAAYVQRTDRKLRAVFVLAGLAVVAALAVAVLALTGVLSGGDPPPDNALTTRELVERAVPSTVLVLSAVSGERQGQGSGWVYDSEAGEIVTNAHVAETGETLSVSVDGGEPREAELVGLNSCEDLAVLKVDDTDGMRTLPRGDQDDIGQGDDVVAIGYPGRLSVEDDLVVTKGVVSVRETEVDTYPNLIQTDAAINGGNSGGPMLEAKGKLVGVNTLTNTLTQNENYAIGVDRVEEILPGLRDGESQGWAGLALSYPQGEARLEPIVTDNDTGAEFFGPEITGVADGVDLGGSRITGSREDEGTAQFVVGIDGEMFGVTPDRLPADPSSWCRQVGERSKGDSAELSILEVDQSGSTAAYEVFEEQLEFR